MTVVALARDEVVAGRAFCSPSLYERDLSIMAYMLEDLRSFIGAVPFETVSAGEHRKLEWTVHGLLRRIVVCDARSITTPDVDVCVVGFFGIRRRDVDSTVLEEVNTELVGEFRNYPGILAYCSIELADGNWANLVVHDRPDARDYWRGSNRHAEAASVLAPQHYESVRIHNGRIPSGVVGQQSVVLERTKYWDYAEGDLWKAVRELESA